MSNFVLFPCYNDIYDGELPELSGLLSGIPPDLIVAFVCDINARKYINQFDTAIDIDVFNLLIARLSEEKKLLLLKKLEVFIENVKTQISIFPLQQMLQLAEYALANYVKEVDWKSISAEKEENILKAILVLNSHNQIQAQKVFSNGKAFTSLDNYIRISWPFMINNIELYNKDIYQITLPLLQSKMLFEYFANDVDFKQFFANFVNNYHISDIKEYVKNLLSLILNGINKEQKLFVSHYETNSLESSTILKHFIREINEHTSQIFNAGGRFFSLLREKPFFKTSIGRTYIINWGFLNDKIYEGVKYDFYENSGIKGIIDWGTYSSKLGKFNEKINFKDMVDRYLKREDTVCLFENDLKVDISL